MHAVFSEFYKHMELHSVRPKCKLLHSNGVREWHGGFKRNCGVGDVIQWRQWHDEAVLSGWDYTGAGGA